MSVWWHYYDQRVVALPKENAGGPSVYPDSRAKAHAATSPPKIRSTENTPPGCVHWLNNWVCASPGWRTKTRRMNLSNGAISRNRSWLMHGKELLDGIIGVGRSAASSAKVGTEDIGTTSESWDAGLWPEELSIVFQIRPILAYSVRVAQLSWLSRWCLAPE
jgi:hypothetical protein